MEPDAHVIDVCETADDAHAKSLDEDLSALLSLGLQLSDVERLWSQNKEVDMSDVYAAGTRLLGQTGTPVKRQVTVGLEIAKRSQVITAFSNTTNRASFASSVGAASLLLLPHRRRTSSPSSPSCCAPSSTSHPTTFATP